MLQFFRMAVLIIMASISLMCCVKKDNTVQVNAGPKFIELADMDTTIEPGDNFFQYANGGWLERTSIPADKGRWTVFDILRDRVDRDLRNIVEHAAREGGKQGTPQQQIGDFFKSGIDTVTINKLGYTPIKKQVQQILSVQTFDEAMEQLYLLQADAMQPLFGLGACQDAKNSLRNIAYIEQGGLGLGNRDYYTDDDERSQEIRQHYVEHIARMFKLIDQKDAQRRAQAIMDFETSLARSSMTNVEERDPFATYNLVTIPELKKMVPVINWDRFFEALNIPEPSVINVTSTPFFKDLTRHVENTEVSVVKDYLLWNVLQERADYLSDDFVRERFHFWGTIINGIEKHEARWKQVLHVVNSLLGEAVGKLYVEEHFPPEAKARMEHLVHTIKDILNERIQRLDWMSEATRKKAQEKLAAMGLQIGYPNKWIDYSFVVIRPDTYCQNVINTSKFLYYRELKDIDKPYDREKWYMTPQTVNAYNAQNSNQIVFPAAILQPPFFFKDADDAVNYGAIGVVIGHEITHGFDDKGRHYDKDGNLQEWWTPEDDDNFTQKAALYGKQWERYTYPELGTDVHINPDLTMGENIADLGGVTLSFNALRTKNEGKESEKIDGLTPEQRFFLAYARIWKNKVRPKTLASLLKNDVHSPGDARVNVVISNIDAFYKAFNITAGKRFLPPDQRIIIW